MKKYEEIIGFYGSGKTESIIYVCRNRNGSVWYCVEGGSIVNLTFDEVEEGVNVEGLSDIDCFTVSEGINSIEEFEEAIES